MSNAVYNLVLQTLARDFPEQPTAALLRAALHGHGLDPATVTAAQMQAVLSNPLDPQWASLPSAGVSFRTLSAKLASAGLAAASAPSAGSSAGGAQGPESLLEADDFEFDDPEYAAAPPRRFYLIDTPEGREELMREFGRMSGVQGVFVTRENGEVLQAKTLRDASQLSSVIAATALLFRRQGLKLLSANLGSQTVCMRPAHGYCLAVVAGASVNIGRLLAELQQAELRLNVEGV